MCNVECVSVCMWSGVWLHMCVYEYACEYVVCVLTRECVYACMYVCAYNLYISEIRLSPLSHKSGVPFFLSFRLNADSLL